MQSALISLSVNIINWRYWLRNETHRFIINKFHLVWSVLCAFHLKKITEWSFRTLSSAINWVNIAYSWYIWASSQCIIVALVLGFACTYYKGALLSITCEDGMSFSSVLPCPVFKTLAVTILLVFPRTQSKPIIELIIRGDLPSHQDKF